MKVNDLLLNTAMPNVADPVTPELTRHTAQEFESLLINELWQAMRRTVPESSTGGGMGGQMFTGLLDEKFAEETAAHGGFGLSDLLIAQIQGSAPQALEHAVDVGKAALSATAATPTAAQTSDAAGGYRED